MSDLEADVACFELSAARTVVNVLREWSEDGAAVSLLVSSRLVDGSNEVLSMAEWKECVVGENDDERSPVEEANIPISTNEGDAGSLEAGWSEELSVLFKKGGPKRLCWYDQSDTTRKGYPA